MKIVHVIAALTKGGAERVLVELANHAVELGHEVAVLCAVEVDPALIAHLLDPRVEQRFIAPGARSPRAAYVRIVPWMLRHRRWLVGRDIVHCHLTFGSIFGTVLQAFKRLTRNRRPAVVETYHAVGMAISRRRRAVHAALLAGREAVAFMGSDDYWSNFTKQRPRRLFATIPNGIAPPPPPDRGACERYKAEVGIPPGARTTSG